MFVWLKKLIVKKAAKEISKKLDLTEGPMQDGKPWYKSKGVLTEIVVVLVGTYDMVRSSLAAQLGWNLPEIPPFLFTLLGAFGIYSRVSADKSITK